VAPAADKFRQQCRRERQIGIAGRRKRHERLAVLAAKGREQSVNSGHQRFAEPVTISDNVYTVSILAADPYER
jgi:hypothetical protein